jgi:hypothetical protein
LTSLFPFVQTQPMIRYWTGDLFEELPSACAVRGYAYHGRIKHAVFDADEPGQILMTGIDVLEAVDANPEVNRTIRFRDLDSLRYPQAAGAVRVGGTLERRADATAISLNVEVTFQPTLYPERATALRREIIERIMARCSRLEAAITGGRASFDLQLVAPGRASPLERLGPLWHER